MTVNADGGAATANGTAGAGTKDAGAATANGAADAGTKAAPTPKQPIAWSDAPVVLSASRNYRTGADSAPSKTTTEPVTFAVPGDIYVKTGNAGNGQVELKYLTPSGVVTCTYKGGSSTAHPTSDLDQMHGRRYRLTGCDNGATAGQSQTASWFSLQVLGGDAQDPSGMTSVAVHLGGGCGDELASPLAPDEVVAMRDGFQWNIVDRLPEIDAEGNPALFHGLVYVDSKAQLAALDRMRVYWSAQPLSQRYMSGLRGKCGRVVPAALKVIHLAAAKVIHPGGQCSRG